MNNFIVRQHSFDVIARFLFDVIARLLFYVIPRLDRGIQKNSHYHREPKGYGDPGSCSIISGLPRRYAFRNDGRAL